MSTCPTCGGGECVCGTDPCLPGCPGQRWFCPDCSTPAVVEPKCATCTHPASSHRMLDTAPPACLEVACLCSGYFRPAAAVEPKCTCADCVCDTDPCSPGCPGATPCPACAANSWKKAPAATGGVLPAPTPRKKRRQGQLTRESQKCDHGFYFGTTCYDCRALDELEAERDAALAQLEAANRERDEARKNREYWEGLARERLGLYDAALKRAETAEARMASALELLAVPEEHGLASPGVLGAIREAMAVLKGDT